MAPVFLNPVSFADPLLESGSKLGCDAHLLQRVDQSGRDLDRILHQVQGLGLMAT